MSDEWTWEPIDNETERMRVPGGWVVRHIVSEERENPVRPGRHFWQEVASSMVYVPDVAPAMLRSKEER